MKNKLFIYIGIIIFSISFLLYAFIQKDYLEAESDYEKIRIQMDTVKDISLDTSLEPPSTTALSPIHVASKNGVRELFDAYEDMVAYVRLPDTRIDYPVMQRAGDNDYYLKKNHEEKRSSSGSIIMDSSCDPELSTNPILYGHNMKSGRMFHDLRYYKDQHYVKEHPTIWLDRKKADGDVLMEEYKVIGCILISSGKLNSEENRKILSLVDEESLAQFRAFIEEYAIWADMSSFDGYERFVTLLTCDYSIRNGRLLVIGAANSK